MGLESPCAARVYEDVSLVTVKVGSEAESFSAVPERRVETSWIQAQSAAIAQAMASICNDEPGRFGVQGGHGRKTLSLSDGKNAAGA